MSAGAIQRLAVGPDMIDCRPTAAAQEEIDLARKESLAVPMLNKGSLSAVLLSENIRRSVSPVPVTFAQIEMVSAGCWLIGKLFSGAMDAAEHGLARVVEEEGVPGITRDEIGRSQIVQFQVVAADQIGSLGPDDVVEWPIGDRSRRSVGPGRWSRSQRGGKQDAQSGAPTESSKDGLVFIGTTISGEIEGSLSGDR